MIRIGETASPVGTFIVAAREGSIVGAAFEEGWDAIERHLHDRFPEDALVADPAVAAPFAAYFASGAPLDGLRVDAAGSPFRRAIWAELRRIPAGSTISYAALAERAGAARAIRAAGSACASNPVCVAIPCHRVVRSGGALGRYGAGIERKAWLLEHERARAAG